jgi:hypothetical protein
LSGRTGIEYSYREFLPRKQGDVRAFELGAFEHGYSETRINVGLKNWRH